MLARFFVFGVLLASLPAAARAQRGEDLLDAVRRSDTRRVETLLSGGADPDRGRPDGWTPLMQAAAGDDTRTAELLARAGADPGLRHRAAGTALDVAERAGHAAVAALLRRLGARGSGASIGDRVCVRPWDGDGFCGVVEHVTATRRRVRVTALRGCARGCPADDACSAGRGVGEAAGLGVGDSLTVPSSCLSDTGVPGDAPAGGDPGEADAPGATPGPFTHAGITHVSWWHDQYTYADATAARTQLASTGAGWAGVLVAWYMDARSSSALAPDPRRTPTDLALLHAIGELRALGLRVMLKPHVDVQDGTWRGTIQPRDPGAWFASYRRFLLHQAALAEAAGVELLVVGTELVTLSGARYIREWLELIAAVRGVYSGQLTYAANANHPADEHTQVPFWGALDLAGLDVYTPLTDRFDPSPAELQRAWFHNRDGHDMVAAYRNWQRGHGRPVIFTEIGYRSLDGTNRAPWDFQATAAPDPEEQAACYRAAFEVWTPESAWLRGMFWWAWGVPEPLPGDTDYTPRGKPAEDELRVWFPER